MPWAVVLDTPDPVLIAFAKDVLKEVGIPFYAQGEEIAPRMEALNAIPFCRIEVPADCAAEARALLEEIEQGKFALEPEQDPE